MTDDFDKSFGIVLKAYAFLLVILGLTIVGASIAAIVALT